MEELNEAEIGWNVGVASFLFSNKSLSYLQGVKSQLVFHLKRFFFFFFKSKTSDIDKILQLLHSPPIQVGNSNGHPQRKKKHTQGLCCHQRPPPWLIWSESRVELEELKRRTELGGREETAKPATTPCSGPQSNISAL